MVDMGASSRFRVCARPVFERSTIRVYTMAAGEVKNRWGTRQTGRHELLGYQRRLCYWGFAQG